ncbi:hypothetical protein BsWGS_10910 [Bradybaena similaris]
MPREVNQSQTGTYADSFILDDATSAICTLVLYSTVCQLINVFGIATNIINIICFVKQGFKDAINVSLLGLSVSDLCSLITMVWTCISVTPAFIAADLPFVSMDVMYLVSGMPHFAFTRVSSCITAVITVERCVSIVSPLKVKQIITPRRSSVITVCIFIIFTVSATPLFVVNRLGSMLSPLKNKTIVRLTFREDKEQVEKFTLSINNFCIPLCTFVIIAVSTAALSAQLRKNTEWRKRTTNGVLKDRVSSRNLKVSQMVVTMSTLFIVCFAPTTVVLLAMAFVPDMSLNGKYLNATALIGGFIYTLESIKSSANIFIYNHMSTKYRDTLRSILSATKCSQNC